MMKHSFILNISELETRKYLLRLTYIYIYIYIKEVIPSQNRKIKTLKLSSKPKIYPIKKKKKTKN